MDRSSGWNTSREAHMENTMLITDIGSTTTKAILISCPDGIWKLEGLASAPTTVEKPYEDVMLGVFDAVRLLQTQTKTTLLADNKDTSSGPLNPELKWLSTSSAGGGLQILVIGLTKEQSAASAGRAAYGVGGILVDTIAIDDGRPVVEQMRAIESKQPDIILMSGGYDGGAYASVLRQAEILSYCEIKPKYMLKSKIPLVYAGNADAATAAQNILQDGFEFHHLANILPSEGIEQLEHVTEIVHELFLNNVMQQAPGYKAVSSGVSDPVIPTPLGVMQALKLIAETENQNILAVDIGGATTDVYSNIFGKFYRTVSANYGMSYNLCNVFANAETAQLNQWLHKDLSETALRNYMANKMLYPTSIPENDATLHIEQALARLALQLSLQQHLKMNFSIGQIGHFIKIKDDELDPFHEQFFREKLNEREEFRLQDFHQIIGAGGVISHAPKARQAAIIMVDGLQPRGLTELWRDRHFITPHLGKLSQVNKPAALQLLKTECLEPLCLCVRPMPHKLKTGKPALTLELKSETGSQVMNIDGNQLLWLDNNKPLQVKAKGHGPIQLAYDQKELETRTSLPLLIDTRISGQYPFAELNRVLQLYDEVESAVLANDTAVKSTAEANINRGSSTRVFALPYAGRIHVQEGEEVTPDTLLGENLYDPPRIFVLQVFRGRESQLKQDVFHQYLQVKLGDEISSGQLIYREPQSFLESILNTSNYNYYSPVRGRLEKIDWENATLLLREIQDYSFDPVTVKLSEQLGVRPALMKGYLHKHKGDYVTTGEILAVKSWKKDEHIIHAPFTGTITEIDTRKGTLTIQYMRKNLKLYSRLQAKVQSIAKNRFLELAYNGTTISGSIGFGKVKDGPVVWNDQFTEADLKQDFIAVFPFALNREQLQIVARNQLSGIIVPSLAEEDIVHLLGYELGVGITGDEDLPFSIMLTAGFGKLAFSREIAAALQDCTGKHGVLLPATQIRAGVVRPSLIIQ
jgi:uncharacterized protein (TIGR01319 family)